MNLLPIPLVASRLSISESSVRRLIRRGSLAHHRIGNCVRVSEDDLARFVTGCRKAKLTYVPTARRPLALEAARSFALKTLRIARAQIGAGR